MVDILHSCKWKLRGGRMGDYENMTVEELQEELRRCGLPVSGKKEELIARLEGRPDETKEAKEAKEAKEGAVRYVGTSNVRRITEAEWAEVGVVNGTVEWLRDPPHNQQPLSRLSGLTDHQLDLYIRRDPDFEIVEAE
jgi:hypothetical protein